MTEKAIRPETIDQFLKECTIIRLLPNEVCLTINLGNIVQFYIKRIGIHPVLESWEELRQLLGCALQMAKKPKPENIPLHIRFAGGNMPVWLVMKIYSLCVYEADGLFYAGDCIIKI